MSELDKKIDRSIKILKMPGRQMELSYSGGKDSDVILRLSKIAGIDIVPIYKKTTIDPPGTIRHCRENGVNIQEPKMTFFELIKRRGMPTRRARFCCEVLKEYKIMDTSIQGIRRAEGRARKERYKSSDPIICRDFGGKNGHVDIVLPILDWTDGDVEEFIENEGIKCHPLYYENGKFNVKKRLGCIGCPLASDCGLAEFKVYPGMVRAYVHSAQVFLDTHPHTKGAKVFENASDMFVHNVFCKSMEEFLLIKDGMFGKVDMHQFLEDYFKIKI